MPLVRIDVLEGRSDAELDTIGSTFHDVMVDVLGVPERDDFRIVTEHRREDWSFGGGEANYLTLDPRDWR